MKVISYKSNNFSPGILLDKKSGTFQISGYSCPENAAEFYKPVFNWLDEYTENPLQSTTLDFKMTYFNTVTAKVFFMIMSKMQDLSESGREVKIRWYYNAGDKDLEEAGEEFENIFNLNIECIPVENKAKEIEEFDPDDFMKDIL